MESIFQQDGEEMEREAMLRKSEPYFDDPTPRELAEAAALDDELAPLLRETTDGPPADELKVEPQSVATPQPRSKRADPVSPQETSGPPVDASPADINDVTRKHTYRFPAVTGDLLLGSRTTPDLLAELDELCNGWRVDLGRKAPYEDIRDRVCGIYLELNQRGGPAPRFRPQRRIRPATRRGYAGADSDLLNDLQVIDLHWLHSQGVRLRSDNAKWRQLASKGNFSFELAAEFAAIGGSPNLKVTEILTFLEIRRLELAVLQDTRLNKLWRVLQNGRDDAGGTAHGMQFVRSRLESVPSIKRKGDAFLDRHVLLWACDRLVRSLSGSGPQLANLYALATCSPTSDPSNLRRALKSIEKHLK